MTLFRVVHCEHHASDFARASPRLTRFLSRASCVCAWTPRFTRAWHVLLHCPRESKKTPGRAEPSASGQVLLEGPCDLLPQRSGLGRRARSPGSSACLGHVDVGGSSRPFERIKVWTRVRLGGSNRLDPVCRLASGPGSRSSAVCQGMIVGSSWTRHSDGWHAEGIPALKVRTQIARRTTQSLCTLVQCGQSGTAV